MTEDEFQTFCQNLADEFIGGEVTALSRHYSYPMVIYQGEVVRIENRPEDTASSVLRRRDRLREAGIERVRAQVHDLHQTGTGRLRVRASWSYLDGEGRALDASFLTYFCTISKDNEPIIDLIHFESLAFPDTPFLPLKPLGPN